ncbi:hypothetical protein LTR66_012990 [Elasticomyces elasticus]|nr:hypothetical protein LTR66_012990 [Elasticomyces elasticus]
MHLRRSCTFLCSAFVYSVLYLSASPATCSTNPLGLHLPSALAWHETAGATNRLASTDSVAQNQQSLSDTQAWCPLSELQDALEVMQSRFFEVWVGTWPTSIDWTGAVINTYLSATLTTLSSSLETALRHARHGEADQTVRIENEINRYFSQSVAYYFGENAFSIRNQAYDDMLWVVLDWLESIKFIRRHARLHEDYTAHGEDRYRPWYGSQFVSSFSHRARIFYDIASRGWDTSLCGGGMTWNPALKPYKNAITNQLFIAASIGMYLYFPGDLNDSPFSVDESRDDGVFEARPHDAKYLNAAVDGYAWLRSSNMTNDLGLYVDGFHITGWGRNGSHGTGNCDDRNEMLYTYNQGVLLSGLRGLWEGTGRPFYLEDGHELVRNVIAATGWSMATQAPARYSPAASDPWAGLGRAGVLEELCDASGRCDQNGQSFKGIFFHHLTQFCEPLPLVPLVPGRTFAAGRTLALLHRRSCVEYTSWIAHNAKTALKTRDKRGLFGMWWHDFDDAEGEGLAPDLPCRAQDYRNNASVLLDEKWSRPEGVKKGTFAAGDDAGSLVHSSAHGPVRVGTVKEPVTREMHDGDDEWERSDVNERGRGRTVETQGGGVAVLRAVWEMSRLPRI